MILPLAAALFGTLCVVLYGAVAADRFARYRNRSAFVSRSDVVFGAVTTGLWGVTAIIAWINYLGAAQ